MMLSRTISTLSTATVDKHYRSSFHMCVGHRYRSERSAAGRECPQCDGRADCERWSIICSLLKCFLGLTPAFEAKGLSLFLELGVWWAKPVTLQVCQTNSS